MIKFFTSRYIKSLTTACLQVASGNFSPPPAREGKDDLGQLGVAFNTMLRVITERIGELTAAKEALETSLRAKSESEERLKLAMDGSNDGFWDWDIPSGRVEFNKRLAEMISYPLDEMPPHVSSWRKIIHPDDLPNVLEKLNRHLDSQVSFYEAEYRVQAKSGEWRWILDRGKVVLRDSSGKPLRAAGTHTDITGRKWMEGSMKTLSAALEYSPVSILITDRNGSIEYVNPKFCQVSGYSPEEVLGQNPRILKGTSKSEKFYKNLWVTILSGREWVGEFQNRRKNGTLVWVKASISPIFDDVGNITHFVGVREEIEEEKKLQEELGNIARLEKIARDKAEQANKTKSDFLASMSHEIRTPLNAILGMTELLAETSLDRDQSEYLTVVKTAGETLQGLIDDILDLSKIEAGMLQLDNALFNLPDCIHQLIAVTSMRASQKRLTVTSSLVAGTPDWMVGDSFRLRQILLNLVGNAIKFTDRGSINLRVEPAIINDITVTVKFSITDTGIGIPPDKLQSIFENFSQADTSTTRRYGGSGLGLSISRRLVEMMGGEIGVESVPGKGSCFHFTCRFGAPSETPSEKLSEVIAEVKTIRPLSILLVDDNRDNRTVLSAYFRRTDHRVECAVNGGEAVAMVKQGGYDLVLMDMEMPVMDGYTAVRLIREWEQESGCAPLPVIALTANALKEDRKKSLDAGCNDHLTKPIHKSRLLEVVNGYASAVV